MSVYQARLLKIREEMVKRGIDLLFLSPSPFLYYATGIREGPYFPIMRVPGDWLSGVFIGPDRGPIFVAQWMLANHAAREEDAVIAETVSIADGQSAESVLHSVLKGFSLSKGRVAVGDTAPSRVLGNLQEGLPHASFSMASEFMDSLLAIKDEDALRRMRRAAEITDTIHPIVLNHIEVGMSVADLALEVDYQFRKYGAEENSFQTGIVFTRADGPPNSPDRRLAPGDSITFDYGCIADGYASDFGRSAYVGEPPAEYRQIHEIVLRAQAAGMAAMKAGQITCAQADKVARQVIEDAGYGPNFTHRLGHAIGIKVHEPPFLDGLDPTVLQAGMTFTVEPSIRIPGQCANRVEDVVLVTEDGGEYLNHCSRELHTVPD